MAFLEGVYMKTLSILLSLALTTSAFAQTAAISFDGDYERREWRTKERPMPDSDLSIKGTAGSFKQFASKKTRGDNCMGKSAPVEVSKIEGDKITLLVKQSSLMADCRDFTATFRYVTVNGKTGLALPNSDELMFIKK